MSAQVSPYLGMIVMGVAYSLLASALWPIAALLIPEYQLGTAYGLMQAIQNLGTALITMAAGTIVDEYGYDWLEVSSHVERMFGVWLGDLFCFPENFLRSFKSFIIEIASDSCSPVHTAIAINCKSMVVFSCRFSSSGCWECPWPLQCACGSVTALPMDTST